MGARVVEREAKILERALKRDMEKWPDVLLYELARLGSPLALEELERRAREAEAPRPRPLAFFSRLFL